MTFHKSLETLDLVDEMDWEDSDKVERLTLEEAGLEESNPMDAAFACSVLAYCDWFYDGEQSEFDNYFKN
jgi:hypothetical protein